MSADEQETFDKVKRYIEFKRLSRHLNTESNESLKSPAFIELEPRFGSNYRMASFLGLSAGLVSFLGVNSLFNGIKYQPVRRLNSFKIISITTAVVFAMRVWKVMIVRGYGELKRDIDSVLDDPVYAKWLYPTRSDLTAITKEAKIEPIEDEENGFDDNE